jgi:hypothetical protein
LGRANRPRRDRIRLAISLLLGRARYRFRPSSLDCHNSYGTCVARSRSIVNSIPAILSGLRRWASRQQQ